MPSLAAFPVATDAGHDSCRTRFDGIEIIRHRDQPDRVASSRAVVHVCCSDILVSSCS
jgi:hypothetical protein